STFSLGTNQVTATVSNTNGCSASCSTSVTVQSTRPTITCSLPINIKCAPPSGTNVTLSINVTDVTGASLVVIWTVNGTPVQTNSLAGGTTNSVRVDLTTLFNVGTNQVTVSVFSYSGCTSTCPTTVTVTSIGNLYRIAL